MIERESNLVFDADHPAFAGHFPAAPIVPGVLLLDAALYDVFRNTGAAVTGIAAAKFLRPAGPGEVLAMTWHSGAGCRFQINSGPHCVASGALSIDPDDAAPGAGGTS